MLAPVACVQTQASAACTGHRACLASVCVIFFIQLIAFHIFVYSNEISRSSTCLKTRTTSGIDLDEDNGDSVNTCARAQARTSRTATATSKQTASRPHPATPHHTLAITQKAISAKGKATTAAAAAPTTQLGGPQRAFLVDVVCDDEDEYDIDAFGTEGARLHPPFANSDTRV